MTKNNLKIVKSGKNQEIEAKEKNKALEAAISQIDENFGKGSVMKLGQKTSINIDAISTGSLSLDLALGIGGLPKGRVVEIYGPEASGKTTLALQVIAESQKKQKVTSKKKPSKIGKKGKVSLDERVEQYKKLMEHEKSARANLQKILEKKVFIN